MRRPTLAVFLALLAALPGLSFAAPSLTADTSRPATSTFAIGEPVTLTFTVSGITPADGALKLSIDIRDEHGTSLLTRDLPVTPVIKGAANLTFSAPNKRLGFYRVFAKLSDGVTIPKLDTRPAGFITYCIVPDPEKRPTYPITETRFGMQGGYAKNIDLWPYLGVRWILGDYNWRNLEPDHAGQFAESLAAAKAKKPNLPSFKYPTSGRPWRVYLIPTLMFAPKWAVKPGTSTYCTGTLTPAGEKAWRNYCLEAARDNAAKYPDLPERIYQVTWEPVYPWGFKGTDEDLIRIYQIAYPAIHEGDPKAVVIGPTGGGCTKDAVKWNLDLLRKGLGRYIDGFSVHPYHPIPPERLGMLDRLRELRDGIRQYVGHDLPIFGTEEGWATGGDYTKELKQARGDIRESLICVGEGFRVQMTFYSTDYPGEPGYGYYYKLDPKVGWGAHKVGPKPVAPAYAAMTYLLEGHTSAGPIEWLGDTALGYAFERGKDVILALWDWGDSPRTVTIPVGVPHVEVFDWMGNGRTRDATGGNLQVTLGPEPIYIKGVSPAIWGSHGRKPLRLAASRLTACPGTTAVVSATVTAPEHAAFHGTLLLRADDRLGLAPISKSVSVAAGKQVRVDVPIALPADLDLGSYPVRASLAGARASAGLMLSLISPVAVDAVDPTRVGGKWGVHLTLHDVVGRAIQGTATVHLRGVPDSTASAPFAIAAKGHASLELDLGDIAVVPSRQYDAIVTLTTPRGYRLRQSSTVNFTEALRLALPAPLARAPAIVLRGRDAVIRTPDLYHGPADLSAIAHFAWDTHALHVAFDVTDDVFLQDKTGYDTWLRDCVQLAVDLDPRLAVEKSGNLFADTGVRHRSSEIDFALTSKGPQAYRTLSFDPKKYPSALLTATECKLSIVRKGDHTFYQASIPWTTLGATSAPVAGSMIGIAATVNDADDVAQKEPKALGLFGGIYPTKDPSKFGILLLSKIPIASPAIPGIAAGLVSLSPSSLKFDGVLGQSQPTDADPLPFNACTGAATDKFGKLWTAAGNRLYRFSRDTVGHWACSATVLLNGGVPTKLGPRTDGDRIYFICDDWKLYSFQPSAASSQLPPRAVCSVPEDMTYLAVAPAGLSKSFCAKGKFFVLRGDDVLAYSASGKSLGTVLALTHPKNAKWPYCSLAVDPVSGDLLVGAYWPDSKIYRYRPDGSQVTTGGWPRTGNAENMAFADGAAWALVGGSAVPLAEDNAHPLRLPSLQAKWTYYPNGLAPDPSGGYWMSTTQGLVHFDRRGRADGLRIGGMPGVSLLSAAPDGTLIAATEGGQRMVRLYADDGPTSPLSSDANEPFRVAAGWTDTASALVCAGSKFIVLDGKARQLWAFDPWHSGFDEKPWVKLTAPKAFSAPRLLALGDTLVWIVDGSKLLEARQSTWSSGHAVVLPDLPDVSGLTALSASGDGFLVAATATTVYGYTRSPDGVYTRLWQCPRRFRKVVSLAATPGYVAASDAGTGKVSVLSPSTGAAVATLSPRDVPGNMKPGAIAAQGPWVFIADSANARIVRARCR